jgi:hypothetical protein
VVVASTNPIPALDFSRAKSTLSEVMSEVFWEHRPRVISRHRGREEMLLVRPDDLVRYLAPFRLEPEVTIDAGETTVALPKLGLLGFGETLDDAMHDLVEELRAYASDFFARSSFYAATDRAEHAPWLLRFALTPPERQLELLYEDSRESVAAPA